MEKTTINCIHLSDIHVNHEKARIDLETVLDHLWNDISARTSIDSNLERIDYVFISGDIAYHGRAEEYDLAEELFLKPLYDKVGIKPEQVFIVPGNHDVLLEPKMDVPLNDIVDDIIKRDLLSGNLESDSFIEIITDRLHHYRKFMKRNFSHLKFLFNDLYWYHVSEIDDWKVGIAGLNSAYVSCGGMKDYGRLFLGEHQVREILQKIENTDLKISLVHHPFDWLAPIRDREYCETRLKMNCSLHMCGHMHKINFEVTNTLEGDFVILPAGSTFEKRESLNAFNYIQLIPSRETVNIYMRRYNASRFYWEPYSGGSSNTAGKYSVLLRNLRDSKSKPAPSSTQSSSSSVIDCFHIRKGKLIERVTQQSPNQKSMNFGLLVGPKGPKGEIFPLNEVWVKDLFRNTPRSTDSDTYNDHVLLKYPSTTSTSGLWGGNAWATGHLQGIGELIPKRGSLDLVEIASIVLEQTIFLHRAFHHIGWKGDCGVFVIIRDIGRRKLQVFYNNTPSLDQDYRIAPEENRILYTQFGILGESNELAIDLGLMMIQRIAKEFAFHPKQSAMNAILRNATKNVTSFRTSFNVGGKKIEPFDVFWER